MDERMIEKSGHPVIEAADANNKKAPSLFNR
jgi:hypothetical protein